MKHTHQKNKKVGMILAIGIIIGGATAILTAIMRKKQKQFIADNSFSCDSYRMEHELKNKKSEETDAEITKESKCDNPEWERNCGEREA